MDVDAARSVITATERNDEKAASCGGDSRHSVTTAAAAACVVSRSYGSIRLSAPSLQRRADSTTLTPPPLELLRKESRYVLRPLPRLRKSCRASRVQILTPLPRLRLCRESGGVYRMMLGRILRISGMKALLLILCGETSAPHWDFGVEYSSTIVLH